MIALFKKLFPHITFILSVCLIVFTILDIYNPVLSLLRSDFVRISTYVLGGVCMVNAVLLYVERYLRSKQRSKRKERGNE
ncbi:MAG: hypothetical protein Q4B99_01540 [Clostridia bacterium]|nr:hypothetical protein [Clostridia bacterium]